MADKQEPDEDTKHCKNCKRDIAAVNFMIHEVHCHRNIVLCKHCDEPVPRGDLDDHFEEYHAPVQCDQCKVSLEKEKLDNHLENECPKRKQSCVYCDLELAQCDLQNHLDFCGTRTERCPRCQRYIMFKDLMQHEQTDCTMTHTPPLPTPASSLNNQRQGPSSFAMDELSRILDEPGLMPPRRPQVSNAKPNNLRLSQNRSRQIDTHNNIYGTSRRRPNATRKATNQKENTNSERARERTDSRPPRGNAEAFSGHGNSYGNNLDMDHLLAMHLHSDLNDSEFRDVGVAGLVPDDEDGRLPAQTGPEDTVLPCEFCDELLSPGELIHHQAVCSGAEFGASSPQSPGSRDNNDLVLPNNSPQRPTPAATTRAQPNIVDNLAFLSAQDRLSQFEPSDYRGNASDEEDIMLPCEFCDTLLPGDMLIQHQAVCDRNGRRTPDIRNNARVQPRGSRPNIRVTNNLSRGGARQRNTDNSHDLPSPLSNSRTPQRLLRRGQHSAHSEGGSRSRQNFLRDLEDDAAASYSRNLRPRNEPKPPAARGKDVRGPRGRRGSTPGTTRNNYGSRASDSAAEGVVVNGASYRNKTRSRGTYQPPPYLDNGAANEASGFGGASRDTSYRGGTGAYRGSGTRPKKSTRGQGRRYPQGEI